MLHLKRIYDEPSKDDGYRILIDRLWPRGVSKQRAAIDVWMKDIAPSADLRVWFNHKPERFEEFNARYVDELSQNPAVEVLKNAVADHPEATLLYAAKDSGVNHAVVLKKYLENKI